MKKFFTFFTLIFCLNAVQVNRSHAASFEHSTCDVYALSPSEFFSEVAEKGRELGNINFPEFDKDNRLFAIFEGRLTEKGYHVIFIQPQETYLTQFSINHNLFLSDTFDKTTQLPWFTDYLKERDLFFGLALKFQVKKGVFTKLSIHSGLDMLINRNGSLEFVSLYLQVAEKKKTAIDGMFGIQIDPVTLLNKTLDKIPDCIINKTLQ